jgi:hypothetical protein
VLECHLVDPDHFQGYLRHVHARCSTTLDSVWGRMTKAPAGFGEFTDKLINDGDYFYLGVERDSIKCPCGHHSLNRWRFSLQSLFHPQMFIHTAEIARHREILFKLYPDILDKHPMYEDLRSQSLVQGST